MAETVHFDTSSFDAGMRDIARLTGKSFSKVVKNEAHAILKKAVSKTNAATIANINAHYDYKGEGPTPPTIINFVRLDGKKPRVRGIRKYGSWKSLKKGNKFDKKKINPQFRILQTELKRRKQYAKDRRGQSKATWIYIAKRAKLKLLVVPGYVQKAYGLFPASLKAKLKGKEVGIENYHILIHNSGRTAMIPKSVKGPGGYHAFTGAYKGRLSFFKINMEKGVFDKMDSTLKKYPGLDVED